MGRDALTRIMAPIVLEPPVLVDCPHPSEVFREDARQFLAARPADICYLDPPYAVHQYGSNYFMLNTIALWDRPPVSGERGPDGRLLRKAGIREDWVTTRSAFCSPATATGAFREVVAAADCRHLAVSYSNEGLVSLEELCDILSETGCLEVHTTDYVKYPGGKQSLRRQNRNVEMLLVVDRTTRASPSSRAEAARHLAEARIVGLARRSFSPDRIRAAFVVEQGCLVLEPGSSRGTRIPMRDLYRFDDPLAAAEALSGLPADRRDAVEARLSSCALADSREEIGVLVEIIRAEADPARRGLLLGEVLRLLNRFAHRKYRVLFAQTLEGLRTFAKEMHLRRGGGDPSLASFPAGLDRIADRAARRFGDQ